MSTYSFTLIRQRAHRWIGSVTKSFKHLHNPFLNSVTSTPLISYEKLDLHEAEFTNLDLESSNFTRSNLSRANFTRSNLRYANFTQANLKGASLHSANLECSSFKSADLKGTDISDANLKWVDLTEANLYGADLSNSDLSNVYYDTKTEFNCTFFNKKTRLPFSREDAINRGMIYV
ncbi:MAG: pentapeptide repeat-containing protein [Halobacteriovoraceae bacterium]|nr:pentapeptide repeat-containing protein [Halobacteriovoraceae bacterium]